MKRRWVTFNGKPYLDAKSESDGGLRVTLNKKKVVLLNSKAYEALGLPAAVEMRYDEENRTIGLAPVDPQKAHAFPIKTRARERYRSGEPKYTYRIINAAAFCKHFEIRPTGTILFNNIDMDNDGAMLLELNEATNIGRGSR